ncbi:MAG: hypothetical protein NZ937_06195 [Armatimonadetes bacterium]|nr:hypothetical protein [Armatimonadota bacterium]
MPEKLKPEECKREVLRYLPQRFGIPANVLDRYNYIWSGSAIWMTSVPLELLPSHKVVQRIGLRALRKVLQGWKPTTPLLQFFDRYITRNRASLTHEQWKQILEGKGIECREILSGEISPGYVALELEGVIIGCGFFNGHILHHQLSKVKAVELAEIFGLTISEIEGSDED